MYFGIHTWTFILGRIMYIMVIWKGFLKKYLITFTNDYNAIVIFCFLTLKNGNSCMFSDKYTQQWQHFSTHYNPLNIWIFGYLDIWKATKTKLNSMYRDRSRIHSNSPYLLAIKQQIDLFYVFNINLFNWRKSFTISN